MLNVLKARIKNNYGRANFFILSGGLPAAHCEDLQSRVKEPLLA